MIVDKDRPAGYMTDIDEHGYCYARAANFFKWSSLDNENVTRDLYYLDSGEIVCKYSSQRLIQ